MYYDVLYCRLWVTESKRCRSSLLNLFVLKSSDKVAGVVDKITATGHKLEAGLKSLT